MGELDVPGRAHRIDKDFKGQSPSREMVDDSVDFQDSPQFDRGIDGHNLALTPR